MSKVAPEFQGTTDQAYPPPPAPAYANPQAPPPYGGPGTGTSTTVVVHQPALGAPGFGPQPGSTAKYKQAPELIVCQHCQATVTTTTHYAVGLFTWLAVGAIIVFGFWMGCCLIPFCLNACKDVVHSCPNCNRQVGRYQVLAM